MAYTISGDVMRLYTHDLVLFPQYLIRSLLLFSPFLQMSKPEIHLLN